MLWIILLYGFVELGIGGALLRYYTLPLLGLTLDTVLETKTLVDIIVGCVGVILGPYLILRGVIIVITLLWAIWEDHRW